MKLTRTSILATSSLIIGGFLGASALVALADSTWTSAPSCTTMPCNNASAPINVGSIFQQRAGNLQILGSLGINGNLIIASGAPAINKVLVSTDSLGTVGWVSTTTLGLGGITAASSGFSGYRVYNSSGTFIPPAGVTNVMVEVWGADGGTYTTNTHTCVGMTGAYGKGLYAVTPNTPYSVTIGTAPSGNSSFASYITSQGGASGSADPQGYCRGGSLTTPTSNGTYSVSGRPNESESPTVNQGRIILTW